MAQSPLGAVAQRLRWHVYPNTQDLVSRVSSAITRISREAIEMRGVFRIVLAGGNTPVVVYEQLRWIRGDWKRWHVYFGDERCLPRGHEDRNDHMATEAWLSHVPIPETQVFSIPAELGATEGARRYALQLAPVASFDLVLLGLGEDGHTASLFPGKEIGIGEHSPDVLAVRGAPKPPPERVSLSARRLSQTRRLYFLIRGASKSAAIDAWRRGDAPIPARFVTAEQGVEGFVTEDVFPAPHSSVALK
jgi:6-phosphogluconolactonase